MGGLFVLNGSYQHCGKKDINGKLFVHIEKQDS